MSEGFSFIHAGDLHLDSPFRGFEHISDIDEPIKENILRRLRNCTFAALENIVDACIEYEVDFLVLSGDIYDLVDRSIRAELRFRNAIERLADRGIPVFAVHGNHDFDNGIRARLTWPENVHFFSPGEVEYREVIRQGKEIARIYGISYPRRDVTENYAAKFKRHQNAPFAIGVLHCNVGGVPEHENYSPCQVSDLVQSGMDYWALGHVHSHRVLKDSPCIVYAGSPQGRNPRETGDKGCCMVNVSENGLIDLQFLAVDDVRWTETRISIDNIQSEGELITQLDNQLTGIRSIHNKKSVVTRIILTGRGPLHRKLQSGALADILEELRLRLAGEEGDFIWPESIKCTTGIPLDKEALRKGETLLADLLALRGRADKDETLRSMLRESLAPLEDRTGSYVSPLSENELDLLLEVAEDLAIDLLWEDDQL
ncbi:MAG: DNA repair exonuclease [Firmicutes bacterium]|nr:DNA repair exonuclease [Bacillota bacterium]